MHVSDLELGVIWKFDRAGHGGVSSDDPVLRWTEQTSTWNANNGTVLGYIGINTVALSPDGRYLFAGTDGGPGGATGSGLLVRIPIHADGSAGKADFFAAGLGANDGLEVGPDGTVYFGDTYNSDVWAFSPDGSRRQLIASRDQFGDPLDNATSLVFLNGCLYETQLGFFKLQLGGQMRRCETWWRSASSATQRRTVRTRRVPYWRRSPPTPRPPVARATHPLFSTLGRDRP